MDLYLFGYLFSSLDSAAQKSNQQLAGRRATATTYMMQRRPALNKNVIRRCNAHRAARARIAAAYLTVYSRAYGVTIGKLLHSMPMWYLAEARPSDVLEGI